MVIQQGRKDKVATLLWIAIASSINVVGTKGISAGGAFTLITRLGGRLFIAFGGTPPTWFKAEVFQTFPAASVRIGQPTAVELSLKVEGNARRQAPGRPPGLRPSDARWCRMCSLLIRTGDLHEHSLIAA
jgi:hypothetical protein